MRAWVWDVPGHGLFPAATMSPHSSQMLLHLPWTSISYLQNWHEPTLSITVCFALKPKQIPIKHLEKDVAIGFRINILTFLCSTGDGIKGLAHSRQRLHADQAPARSLRDSRRGSISDHAPNRSLMFLGRRSTTSCFENLIPSCSKTHSWGGHRLTGGGGGGLLLLFF